MKTIAFAVATAAISIALTTATALAHHPFAPEFDWKKPVTLTGTVTKVEWANPHAQATIDVKDPTGKVTSWAVELGSPRVLEKNYHWKANTLSSGGNVTVDGWLAKDGGNLLSAKSFTFNDGRELFAASSFFDLPGKCVSDEVCIEDKTTGSAIRH